MSDQRTVTFNQGNIGNALERLSDEEIDALAFGMIELDARGVVRRYNATEALITGRRAEDVVGKSFFQQVAPCARRPEFLGRFEEGVKRGELDVVFEYVFDYKMNPTRVRVRMKKGRLPDCYWVLVTRL